MTIVYLVNCHYQSQVSFSISINVNAGDRSPEFGGGLTSDLCVVTTEILGYI